MALRLLLRGRADAPSAPSLALLQPLFPRPYSKLSAGPVPSPSLLRRTSGKQPIDPQTCQHLKQFFAGALLFSTIADVFPEPDCKMEDGTDKKLLQV